MTFVEHLEELRRRLIVSLHAVFLAAGILWGWSGAILTWLARPAGSLVFLAPTEAFFIRLKVAFLAGLFLSLPVILYQTWAFTACAMGEGTRRIVRLILPVSYLLFLAGSALCLFVVVPAAVRFLAACGTENVRPMLAVGAYVDFVSAMTLAFGAVFQIPLILIFLQRFGLVSTAELADKRPYIYVSIFTAAAFLTPGPDVFSQLALAFPMCLLFELSLLVMRLQD